jgi:lipoyl(octanoyl) transferase
VWVGERKIASIGVHIAHGVTTHGYAVNIENDLQPFAWIVPCGLEGVQMTSIVKETRRVEPQLSAFRDLLSDVLAERLHRRRRLVTLAEIEAAAGKPSRTVSA